MSLRNQIQASLESPEQLETVFRQDNGTEFKNIIFELLESDPQNPILQCWRARLNFDLSAGGTEGNDALISSHGSVPLVVLLCMCAGLYAKLADVFPSALRAAFYQPNISLFTFVGLIAFFIVTNQITGKLRTIIFTAFVVCLCYSNVWSFIYAPSKDQRQSDTFLLATLHMPFVLWSLLAMSYMASVRGSLRQRINFLSYNGEALIYTGLILIGGMALTGLTFALFSAINVDMTEWYLQWVVVFGSVSAPIVATYIAVNRFVLSGKIAPLLAKIFSPLLLATLVPYLLVVASQGKSPFEDRDFLIVFNCMLIGVLAVTVFSIVERASAHIIVFGDYINTGLLGVALLINVIALSAILFRLTSYGFTPNRVAVLGSNVLIFAHLGLLLRKYIQLLVGRADIIEVQEDVARYLPVYSLWSVFVVFILPIFFMYR